MPSGEKSELANVLYFKPGLGQNIAQHASPAAKKCTLLFFAFSVDSASFVLNLLPAACFLNQTLYSSNNLREVIVCRQIRTLCYRTVCAVSVCFYLSKGKAAGNVRGLGR